MSDLKLQVFDTQSQSIFNVTESSGINCIGKMNILNTIDSQSNTDGGAITIFGGLSVSKTTRLYSSIIDFNTVSNAFISSMTASNINITGELYKNGGIFTTGNTYWSEFITGGNTNIFYTSGNIGINVTSPTSYLTVSGGNSINSTTGAAVIWGGLGVTNDFYIDGTIYVGGTPLQLNTNVQIATIGSYTGTGVFEKIVNVSMPDNTYTVLGNLQTVSTNKNVYSTSFASITNSQFTALIYRIDALGSGWTDPDLKLVYTIN